MSNAQMEVSATRMADHASLDIERLRHPDENVSGIWLWIFGSPILFAGAAYSIMSIGLLPLFIFLFARMSQLFALAYFKTNAIAVGPQQFSEIHESALRLSARLGIAKPDVYIIQENLLNAFAARIAGKSIIVLHSGIVDSIYRSGQPKDLDFVIAHELGHIAAGHLSLKHRLMTLGSWFVYVGLWHRRSMEYTCDHIALRLVGDLELARRAFSHLVVGGVLAGGLNHSEAQAQLRAHEGEFFVRYRNILSLYPSHLARLRRLSDLNEGRNY